MNDYGVAKGAVASDHDILIEVKTLTGVLLDEVRRIQERMNDELEKKANRTELVELSSQFALLREEKRRLGESISRTQWLLAIGVGVVGAAQFFVPLILKH